MASRKRTAIMEEFIELYKSEPCLWLVKSKDYHDRNKRTAAYAKLTAKLKEVEPNSTKDDVLKKINSLRSNVRKEKKKYKESSSKSGASTDDVYKPTLWYYNFFDFLGDDDTPRKSLSNIDDIDGEIEEENNSETNPAENTLDDNNTENTIEEQSVDDQSSQAQNSRKSAKSKKGQETLTTDVLLSVRDHFKRLAPVETQEDRYDLLGRTVAIKIRTLGKQQRLIAEKIINDTLYEAEMGTLIYRSSLSHVSNVAQYQSNRSRPSSSSSSPVFIACPTPSPNSATSSYSPIQMEHSTHNNPLEETSHSYIPQYSQSFEYSQLQPVQMSIPENNATSAAAFLSSFT